MQLDYIIAEFEHYVFYIEHYVIEVPLPYPPEVIYRSVCVLDLLPPLYICEDNITLF